MLIVHTDFYLIDPPPGALHKPVSPSKIVFAGDSAGSGLCLSVLTVLRDMGIPQPAGAVLISPWVDLTHSFPSVMQNTETVRIQTLWQKVSLISRGQDIIPPYGFIHKPSTTWPIHPLPDENGRARAVPTQTNPPPMPGHADTLRPKFQAHELAARRADKGKEVRTQDLKDEHVGSQEEMLASRESSLSPGSPTTSDRGGEYVDGSSGLDTRVPDVDGAVDEVKVWTLGRHAQKDPQATSQEDRGKRAQDDSSPDYDPDFWEPKPPKVLMNDPTARPLELHSQIQLYATNEYAEVLSFDDDITLTHFSIHRQLTHPLVSPVLQGSLGNLCPLYIICGDGEVLRDEIIYMAHKAAHPEEYPARSGTLREGRRQKENTERFKTPTKVCESIQRGTLESYPNPFKGSSASV